jgi:ABC-type cobalamin/Fe3+-siderophores transport system ATPase subunit
MIRRFFVHNFRCLENFELPLGGSSSALLIGKNGAGKTTVAAALEVLQKIARGTNRVGDVVKPADIAHGRGKVPVRFEIEVALAARIYAYRVAFDYPDGFRELRVFEENLAVDGTPVFSRHLGQFRLASTKQGQEANFPVDWHLVALPIVQARGSSDPISVFTEWLANTLILRPVPRWARGDSEVGTLRPNTEATNIGEWWSGLLASDPSAYATIDSHLKQMMPDLQDIKNPLSGGELRKLVVRFANEEGTLAIFFESLSDGEKCFLIWALAIAANDAYGPLLCFWDEPDNFLAPSEIQHVVTALRRAFEGKGQLIAASHNPEVIRAFSDENTLLLYRKSHLEPATVRSVEDIRAAGSIKGDLVGALLRGDVAV